MVVTRVAQPASAFIVAVAMHFFAAALFVDVVTAVGVAAADVVLADMADWSSMFLSFLSLWCCLSSSLM